MDILIRMLMAVLKDRKHKKQRRVLSTVLAAVVVFMTTYSLILPAITLEESTAETTDGIFLESADVSEADPADDDVDPSGELLLTDDAREESAPASDGWEDGLIEDADWEENGELADIPDEPALTDTGDEATPDGILEEATDAAEAEEDTQALSFTDGELTVRETLVSRQGAEDFLRLTYGAEARIPEDTVCSAQAFIPASSGAAMDEGSSLAEKYEQAAREKAARDYPEWDKIEVRMFDLQLAANGQTVQAEDALHSELTLAQPIRSEALLLLHFEDNEAQEELRRIYAGETAGASSVEVHLPEVMHDAEFIRNANGEVYKIRFASQTLNTFAVVIRGESEETENRKEETAHETEPLTEAGTEAATETLTESTAAGDETEEAAETETGNVYAETEEATEAVTETASEATEEATEDTTESEESVGEGETESELEEQYPEVELSDSTQYTQVKVYAPEGAFPEGTQMLLSDVEDDETIAAICDAALAENSLVQKVHAVDISFRNSRNEEIEPLLPIRVEMTAEKCAEVGSSSVSSSVVHVDDSGNATIVENAQKVEAEAEDEKDADKLEDVETIAFEAKEFSVYALVYTVDFHWEVDGQMYEFSLPGGGFISFSDLIEVLGVAKTGENDDVYLPGEVPGINDQDATGENGSAALTLDGVVVSEKTREFVADVKSVVFSSPELVDVSKVESETTVGGIKESRGLDVQYSAELTEEQIAEINAQTVVAGDWALISVQPFESTESLTVTMKTGEVFEIRVTDAQLKKTVKTASGETWEITITYDDSAEIPKDAELRVEEILPEDERYEQYYQQSLEKISVGEVPDTIEDESGSEMIDETAETASEEAATTTSYAHIFDIQIWAGDQQIEPASGSTVSVSIKLLDAPENEDTNLQVVHFGKDGLEVMELAENNDETKAGGTELNFVTDEFSVYAIVGTETISAPFTASDGKTYEVTVNYGKDAGIPAGAKLKVSEVTSDNTKYDGYVEQAADTIARNVGDLGYVKLLDIEIVDGNENKVTLNAPVDVQIKLLDKEYADETTQVIHFEGAAETPVLMDSSVDEDVVSFSTDGFSIYAVVGEGDEGDNARMTLHFMVNGTDIAQMIVKNADTREDLNTIIYDPGTGDTNNLIFKGWSLVEDYTVADADTEWTTGAERGAMDIDDIRDWAEAKRIKEFEDVYVYAMLYDSYDISFFDEDNAIVHSDLLIFKAGDTNGVSYYINVPYEPKGQDFKFNGWYKDSDSTITPDMTPYPNQTTVTIKSDTMFSANPDEGHWLVFRENGDGASYTPPQFVLKNQKPTQPATNPTRNGYTFGGWYTDAACTSGKEFDFNAELTERTTVYAKWNVKNPADYTVIIWQQQVTGDQYDFVTSLHLSGTTNTNVNSVSQRGTGDGAYARINGTNYQYTGFHLKEFDQIVNIVPEGTSVVNVYYDRNEYTLTFQAPPEATASEGQRPWVYTYQSYDGVTLESRRLYYHDGKWYQTRYDEGYLGYSYWGEWTGGVYSSNQYSEVKTITARYGADVSSNFPIVGTNGVTYNSGERWKPQTNSVNWSEVMLIVQTMPAGDVTFRLSAPVRPLKTMNYYVEALPTDTGTVTAPTLYNVNDNSIVSSGGRRFKLDFTLNARYNQVTIEDILTLDGFEILGVDKQKDSQNRWIRDTENNGTLNIYYTRVKNRIIYNDGVFVNGNGEAVSNAPAARTDMHESDEILYGLSVADQENEYNPTLTGYVLEGWYLNKECVGDKFDFSTATMPKGGIQLYAKWVQVQYRVFLHANAKIDDENDPSLDWGGQEMSFRVNYNEQIAGGNPIKGTRDDYEIIGWYFDEALTQPFNIESYYLNDTTVTDTYDKTRSTELDKWSDPTESTNKDVTNNRFWITRSLDLYAKWRAKLEGANGIYVIYDATDAGYLNNGGTQVQYLEDSLIYKDSSAASAKGASTAKAPASEEDEEMQFLYWEVCRWTGEDELTGTDIDYSKFVGTGEHVYPGNEFTVLKANASVSEVEKEDPEDQDKITHAKYTVLLRAVYGPKGTPTPTHITWYANNGTGDTVTDPNLQINGAVDVRSATTFEREGYKFLGWARKVEVSNDEGVVQTIDGENPDNLDKTYTESDLFLKWDGQKFVATANTEGVTAGNEVKKIAADESDPYHGMVAVWQRVYKVTVKKTVVGTPEDENIDFSFAPVRNSNGSITSGEDYNFTLKHNGSKEVFKDLLKNDIFSVTETANTFFDITVSGKYTDDDGVEHVINNLGNGTEITIQGDTEITFTNTRKAKKVKIYKVDDSATPVALSGVGFTLNGETVTTGENGYTDIVTLNVSPDPYDLIETQPVEHYTGLSATVPVTVSETGVTVPNGTENVSVSETPDSDGSYIITVVNPRKQYTVTVIKNVDGNIDADKDAQYSFTATGLAPATFQLYGRPKEAQGTTAAQSNEKVFENVPYNTSFSIAESDEYGAEFDTSITIAHADGTPKTITGISTGDITVDGDVTITFTNSRKTAEIILNKEDDKGNALSGARFTLINKSTNQNAQHLVDGEWVDVGSGSKHEFEVGRDGSITIEGLPVGDYVLTESKAPDGYVILVNAIEFSVSKDGEAVAIEVTSGDNASANNNTLTVTNTPGQALPYTGGPGTLLYTLSGIVLMLGAALMYGFRMRRRERRLN